MKVRIGLFNKLLGKLKPYIEAFPTVAGTYRIVRDFWAFQRKHRKIGLTPYGFKLTGNSSMQNGSFEPEETAVIIRLLREIDVFVDIGANNGN